MVAQRQEPPSLPSLLPNLLQGALPHMGLFPAVRHLSSPGSSPQKTKRRAEREGETDREIRCGQKVREEEECKPEVRTQKGPQVMGQRSRETGGNLGEG